MVCELVIGHFKSRNILIGKRGTFLLRRSIKEPFPHPIEEHSIKRDRFAGSVIHLAFF